MKKYFITGLIILLPFALTIFIAIYIINLLTGPFIGIAEDWIIAFETERGVILTNHDLVVLVSSRIIIGILLLLFILLLGFCARRFFLEALLNYASKIFSRIPFVKSVYRISKDITNAIFSKKEKTFKRTVLVPFPSENTCALGLVTGEIPLGMKQILANTDLVVFVPTSPHPISGFLLLTPRKHAQDINVSTEDVFKFLLSCGVMQFPTSDS